MERRWASLDAEETVGRLGALLLGFSNWAFCAADAVLEAAGVTPFADRSVSHTDRCSGDFSRINVDTGTRSFLHDCLVLSALVTSPIILEGALGGSLDNLTSHSL